jgi:hypothetical protein
MKTIPKQINSLQVSSIDLKNTTTTPFSSFPPKDKDTEQYLTIACTQRNRQATSSIYLKLHADSGRKIFAL